MSKRAAAIMVSVRQACGLAEASGPTGPRHTTADLTIIASTMRSALILLLTCLLPAALAGQSPDDRVDPAPRRLSLVLEMGASLGGPGAGLAAQLRRAGFDDTDETCFIFCSGPIAHPTQDGPGVARGLTARFAISGTVALGAGYGNTSLGGSVGYRANAASLFGGDHVISRWDATMVWAGAFWKPHPALRVGGGPGWYRLKRVGPGPVKLSRVGLTGEAGVEVPADRRLFLNLAIRVHLIPAKAVEHGGTVPITLRPNWTHATLLVGIGVRL